MNITNNRRTLIFRQRGMAVVELAISLPVLFFLAFGIAELGRVLYQYNTLNQANRDATRYLASNATVGTTDVILIDAVLEAQTKNLAVYGNTGGSGAPLLDGLQVGDVSVIATDTVHVSVDVLYAYNALFGATLPSFGFSDSGISMVIDLQSTVIMRAL